MNLREAAQNVVDTLDDHHDWHDLKQAIADLDEALKAPATSSDGGPAFPTKREALDPRSIGWHMQEGMTLRDWFAGMALQGLISHVVGVKGGETNDYASRAFQYADAMTAARERRDA